MANSSFRWSGTLEGNLRTMGIRNKRAMVVAAKKIEADSRTYMKSNAPWQDQTGNARNGLNATTQISPNFVRIVLFHSVPYGIYLETRWDGRYAIIEPTVQAMAPKYFALVASMIFRGG